MAFRENAYRPSCARCDGPSAVHCARCNTTLCADHAPEPAARCSDCERDFAVRAREGVAADWSEVAIRWAIGSTCAAFWVLGYAALTRSHLFLALALAALASAVVGYPAIRLTAPALERLHSSHKRQLFLRERKLLPRQG